MTASLADAAEGGTASCKSLYDAVVRCGLRRCEIRHDRRPRTADSSLEFRLLVPASAPMFWTERVRWTAESIAMRRRAARRDRIATAARDPMLPSGVGDNPDPRLIELVRLIARRAARRWFKEIMERRDKLRS